MRKGNLLVFLSIITTLIFLLTTGCRRDRVAKTSPVLSSTSISDITAVSAVAGGNISNDGGSPVTARVWYGVHPPTLLYKVTMVKQVTAQVQVVFQVASQASMLIPPIMPGLMLLTALEQRMETN